MLSAGIGATLGSGLWWWSRRSSALIGRREAMLLVAMTWLLGAAMAAMPYFLWSHLGEGVGTEQPFDSYVDAYFEAMSGLTTTGATVIADIPAVPHSLLLWRALTQWLGGLGIVVLFVAVLPSLGVGARKLYRFEAPGPATESVRPQIRETARVLWLIYFGLTVVEASLLKLAGMSWFDAVAHTFATLSTGGFSTQNASMGYFPSIWIDSIVIVFMVLAGVNFGLFYHLIRGQWRVLWKDTELRVYMLVLLIASVIVAASLVGGRIHSMSGGEAAAADASLGEAARHGVFQVVSIQTTSGFCTADFNWWAFVPQAVLVLLMFVGASAGSTGGGIKIIRIIILFKVLWAEVERVFRPHVVRSIKVGRSVINAELRQSTLAYILGILLLFLIGAGALMLLEASPGIDFKTAATASAATLNNIGPGLGMVGATENYARFSTPSKLVLSLLMALGRLELFAILVLFTPRFWRTD
ncbi:MAG: potassium transporter [Planctomycetaceae bacterium]|nr:potassium transporter [Planctomycetaceae bacterium]